MNKVIQKIVRDLEQKQAAGGANIGWIARHQRAWNNYGNGIEKTFRNMVVSWADYADCYQARYECLIGTDGVLGKAWKQQGVALRALLNGELGDLDAGTLDGMLLGVAAANGTSLE